MRDPNQPSHVLVAHSPCNPIDSTSRRSQALWFGCTRCFRCTAAASTTHPAVAASGRLAAAASRCREPLGSLGAPWSVPRCTECRAPTAAPRRHRRRFRRRRRRPSPACTASPAAAAATTGPAPASPLPLCGPSGWAAVMRLQHIRGAEMGWGEGGSGERGPGMCLWVEGYLGGGIGRVCAASLVRVTAASVLPRPIRVRLCGRCLAGAGLWHRRSWRPPRAVFSLVWLAGGAGGTAG